VPGAPLGAGDPTRRHGIEEDGCGPILFPGLTAPEAREAARTLGPLTADERRRRLVAVALPVVVSDGAGPYLLDARGRLTLAVADHPAVPGGRVAIGRGHPRHRVGLVAPAPPGTGWRWEAWAEVSAEDRVAALDGLDAVADAEGLPAWTAAWSATA
jgi:hypothetical protein